MNEQKFEAKVKDLYAYEDEMLAKMQEFVKPYNDELIKQGYEIVCRLLWKYPGDEDLSLERLPIIRKENYFCFISVQFQKIGAEWDSEEGEGFQLFDDITHYWMSFWVGWSFKKCECKYIYKNFRKFFDMVKSEGLEKASKIILDKEFKKNNSTDVESIQAHNNTIKFYKFGKAMTVMNLVLMVIAPIFFIAFIIIKFKTFVLCGIMSLIWVIALLYFLARPFYVKLDSDSVTEINAYGKIKKTHELKSLKEIRIIRSRTRNPLGDYLYFNFSEKDYSDYEVYGLLFEDDITILEYSEKNKALIKEFTDVPIIDMRFKRKK